MLKACDCAVLLLNWMGCFIVVPPVHFNSISNIRHITSDLPLFVLIVAHRNDMSGNLSGAYKLHCPLHNPTITTSACCKGASIPKTSGLIVGSQISHRRNVTPTNHQLVNELPLYVDGEIGDNRNKTSFDFGCNLHYCESHQSVKFDFACSQVRLAYCHPFFMYNQLILQTI